MYEKRRNTVAIGTRTLGNTGKTLTVSERPVDNKGKQGTRRFSSSSKKASNWPACAASGCSPAAARADRCTASAAEQLA